MKQNTKLLSLSSICCILVFIIPFILNSDKDSFNSILSTAFTGVGATATVITMIIAITLYQKYGMDSKLIEKQTDKVFELIDVLKGKSLTIHTEQINFFLRFINIEGDFKNDPLFNEMYPKKIMINAEDYTSFIKPIQVFMRSYLLPSEIKDKLKFLDLIALGEELEFTSNDYVKMTYECKTSEEFLIIIPIITVEEFIDHKNILIKSIDDWLSKHTNIKLDFELEKSN
ncbi:hypothetical protein [Chryseobacterium sp. VD8]|uniref:hypothetical protein n=1 Tax=Chryseobacterium sp. VD8 TaxID=3081254 RepID=UPI0030186AEC